MRGYEQGYGEDRRRRWPVAIAIAVVIVVLAAGAYAIGEATAETAQSSAASSQAPATVPNTAIAAPPPAMAPAEVAGKDPVTSAMAWLRAYRTARFDDPTPTAWIDHVRPVVTDKLAASYERYRDGSVGADWQQFVSEQCVTDLEDANAVIPDEAPRTATTVNVQVAGTLRTHCVAAPTDGGSSWPDEPASATVSLKKARDGLWRVDERLY